MKIKTVFFDIDGLLIDSEKAFNICWRQAGEETGYPLTLEQSYRLRSMDHKLAAAFFTELFGDEKAYSAVRVRRQDLMKEYNRTHPLELKKGAREILSYLKDKGYDTAVVTSSQKERARSYLSEVELQDSFTKIISADLISRGKPYPDIYLFACEAQGVKAEECIAIEDSPNGLKSAHDAGCHTIMIPDLTPYDEEVAPYVEWHFDSLFDVIGSGIL